MGTIRKVKWDWTQGTSSQAPWRRPDTQDETMSNCEPDPIFGLMKRNGTDFIATLQGSEEDYLTFQFRQYIIRIREGSILVEDENGEVVTVNDLTYSNFSYLDGTDPKSDIDVAIIGDVIFIVSKLVTVLTTASDAYTARGQLSSFSDLIGPPSNPQSAIARFAPLVENDKFQVLTTFDATPAGYYKFLGGDYTQGQNWERIAAPSDPDAVFVPATMPHLLVFDQYMEEFNFGANLDWGQRISGNSISNKVPRFANNTIDTVNYIQGRTVIVGGGSIVTSQGGGRDIYSFWIDDVQRTVSTDPLNLDLNFPEVGVPLRSAVISDDLLINCTQGQIVLTGGQDPINNTSGRIRKLTSFPGREIPIVSNGQLCIVADENNFIHAYSYQSYVTGTQWLGRLNDHNQKLLQATQEGDLVIRRLYLLSDRLFIISDRDTVVIRMRWTGEQFEQLAIHTWQFGDGNERIIYADQWIAHIRLITINDTTGEFTLVQYYPQIEQAPVGWNYAPCLDYRQLLTSNTYDSDENITSFTVEGKNPTEDMWIVTMADDTQVYTSPVRVSGKTVKVRGDYRNQDVYIGFKYLCQDVLTNIYATPGNVITRLKEIQVAVLDTGSYVLKYGRKGVDPWEKGFGPQVIGASEADTSIITTRIDKCVGSGDARYSDITLESDSPTPVIFSAITFIIDEIVPGGKFNT